MREINVAILGAWAFHATEFVERNRQVPGCHMVAAWDEDPVRGRIWAQSLGMTFAEDYHTILRDPEIDAVVITSATRDHARMSLEAAEAGKAVMVEKAPMLTKESAGEVRTAVEANGVLYTVSDPIIKREVYQLKKMADSGIFGDITMLHVRNAHAMALSGELPERFFNRDEAGGGVVMDVGCHGVHLLWWFLGMPVKCAAVYGQITEDAKKGGVEDNAAVSYLFPKGAIGIAESSWTGHGDQWTVDLYGTKGCAHAYGGQVHYCLEDKQWRTITREEMPPMGKKPMEQWLDTLINGTEYSQYHMAEAAELAEMLEAANLASEKAYLL